MFSKEQKIRNTLHSQSISALEINSLQNRDLLTTHLHVLPVRPVPDVGHLLHEHVVVQLQLRPPRLELGRGRRRPRQVPVALRDRVQRRGRDLGGVDGCVGRGRRAAAAAAARRLGAPQGDQPLLPAAFGLGADVDGLRENWGVTLGASF